MATVDQDFSALFNALGDPRRRQILEAVGSHGTQSAADMAARLPITRQAISRQLLILTGAGVLRRFAFGWHVRYQIQPGEVRGLAAWLHGRADRWEEVRRRLLEESRLGDQRCIFRHAQPEQE